MLFNLEADPSEERNLADQNPERVEQLQRVIAKKQGDIDREGARELYMTSTNSDRKGFGPLIVRASLLSVTLLFLVFGLFYGLYRLFKNKLQSMRQGGVQ